MAPAWTSSRCIRVLLGTGRGDVELVATLDEPRCSFSKGGRLIPHAHDVSVIACLSSSGLQRWNLRSGTTTAPVAVPFDSESSSLLIGSSALLQTFDDHHMVVRDTTTGQTLYERSPTGRDDPAAWTASADGRTLAVGRPTGGVDLVDVSASSPARTVDVAEQPPSVMTFSPDGRVLVAATADGEMRSIDVATGHTLASWSVGSRGPETLAFSRAGAFVAGTHDDSVDVWNPVDGHALQATPVEGHPIIVEFGPDDTTLLSLNGNGTVAVAPCSTTSDVKKARRAMRQAISERLRGRQPERGQVVRLAVEGRLRIPVGGVDDRREHGPEPRVHWTDVGRLSRRPRGRGS
jgi:WD40 repeat protein